MTLEDFFINYSHKQGGVTPSGKAFIEKIFFPMYDEYGLDFIEPEEDFYIVDPPKRYRIDFIVKTSYKHYLLEIDDRSHYTGDEAYAESMEKKNNIQNALNQGSFTCDFIDKEYETKPDLIDISLYDINERPEVIERLLRQIFIGDEDLNPLLNSNVGDSIKLRSFQQQTLDAINSSRDIGDKKGLISLTTGIGKTFISIFHAKKYGGKVLFLAHLKDILGKNAAQGSFKKAWPEIIDDIGIIDGENKDLDKQITIATMQSFSKKELYEQLPPNHFDTIIIDECHHASAASYEKIIEYFDPKFLLGMTATPIRTDMQDVTKIFGDNLIYEITREEATERGWICGYEYRLLEDNIDYENIVWNGSRYEEKDLNEKLMVEKRDIAILKEYNHFLENEKNGNPTKTIGFCHSVDYAEYMAKKFSDNGFNAKAIHSNKKYLDSQERTEITDKFRNNEVDIVFTVNIFNEGVDFPDVECLLMLRPTESHVIMSQQLGRGLRMAPRKDKVHVIDFVSNDKKLLSKFEFLGFGDKPQQEKDIYYYDNKGNKVLFSQEIFDTFVRLREQEDEIAARSKPIDMSKISREWQDYGEVLKKYYANNYYWNIGKQYGLIESLKAANLIETHFDDLGSAALENALIKEKGTGKSTNNRILNRAKLTGFVKGIASSREFTEVYQKAKLLCDSKWEDIEKYESILEEQFQKLCFHGPQNSDVNKHGNTQNRKDVSEIFSIFYIIYLYKILLEVGKKTQNYSISLVEFNAFVITSSNHFDFSDKVELIMNLRAEEEGNKKEIEKWFKEIAKGDDKKGSELDTRITSLFEFSPSLTFDNDNISINRDSISEIYDLIHNFETMLIEGGIPLYSEDPDGYEEMLCSLGTPWQKS